MAISRFYGLLLASNGQRRVLARIAGTALFLVASFTLSSLVSTAHAGSQCGAEPGAANCGDQPVDLGSAPTPAGSRHYIGNPIDVITGNKYQPGHDFAAFASPLIRTRHYNTALAHQNIGYGAGWRDTYSLRLYKTASGYQLIQSDGRAIAFHRSDANPDQYITEHATDGTLNTHGSISWQLPDGRTWTFVGSYPTKLELPDGTWLELTYKDKRLHTVTDDLGDSLQYFYSNGPLGLKRFSNDADGSQPGHLRCVQLPDGSGIRYGYDASSNLVSVRHRDGYNWKYGYEDERFLGFLTEAVLLEVLRDKTEVDTGGCNNFFFDLHLNNPQAFVTVVQQYSSEWKYDDSGRVASLNVPLENYLLSLSYENEYTDVAMLNGYGQAGRVNTREQTLYYRFWLKNQLERSKPLQTKSCKKCEWNNLVPVIKNVYRWKKNNDLKRKKYIQKSEKDCFLNREAPDRTEINIYSGCEASYIWEEELRSEIPAPRGGRKRGTDSRLAPVHLFKPKKCPLPEGMSCTDLEKAKLYADLASCAYDPEDCPGSWVQLDGTTFNIPEQNFTFGAYQAILLFNEERNEYVVSFKGTSLFSIRDWHTNVENHIGLGDPIHYEMATSLARRLDYAFGALDSSATLSFTGHSLGGGLATIAALATGHSATVFNAASVSSNTIYENMIDMQVPSDHIEVINTTGDVVSDLQNFAGAPAAGNHTYIGNPNALTSISAHFMSSVQEELETLSSTYCNGNS